MAAKTYTRQSLWRLLGLLKPKRAQYVLGLSGRVILSTVERMYIAYLLKIFVDAVTSRDTQHFRSILLTWILFYVAFVLVSPFIVYLWRSAIYQGTANIREAVFKHLQRLPLGYYELRHSGDILSILTNDISAAEQAYQQDLLTVVEATVQGISAVVFMMVLDWELALVVILSSLAPLVTNSLFAGPLRVVGQEIQARLGTLSERMADLLAGFQVIRTFSLGDWIIARFSQANDQVLESSLRRVRLEAALASANGLAGLFRFLPYMIGAYLVIIGQTTLGVLIALIQLTNQVAYFVYSIGGTVSRIQSALAATDRIFDLLDSTPEPEHYAPEPGVVLVQPASQEKAIVEFKDVKFHYAGDQDILKGISFDIHPGQKVAFAGPSGGGKSTIFKLLLGCYPTEAGVIFISARPIHSYNLADLRELFAYVPQDSYLFSGSILENIRYGKPGASDEEIMEAAKAAFAHDFVMEFPEGYQTLVGERGARLSGGQRQRVAIARALLKDAPVLLLDEATSSLDSESEQIVQEALQVLMKGRTTLVIAHRFSTIIDADEIFVIEDGRVVEQGRHDDLMTRGGVYANLYELQFKL